MSGGSASGGATSMTGSGGSGGSSVGGMSFSRPAAMSSSASHVVDSHADNASDEDDASYE
jgi:hypothetical protein